MLPDHISTPKPYTQTKIPINKKNNAEKEGREYTETSNNTINDIARAGFQAQTTTPEGQLTFDKLVERSRIFDNKIHFPTIQNRIESIATTQKLREQTLNNALNTRPIIHEDTLVLIEDFLNFKKLYGTQSEKSIYENATVSSFIDRLITKRPVAFFNDTDVYLLRDGEEGEGGFENIGTDEEKAPLLLKDYISYDEMLISALISVSVPTHFINNGIKDNHGNPGIKGSYEKKGILIGMVGARFEKPGFMEWKHMVITPEQNVPENGYGIEGKKRAETNYHSLEIWAKFYGEGEGKEHYFPTYEEAANSRSGKYLEIGENTYFNINAYKMRLKNTIEPFLMDANERAQVQNKQAYVFAYGAGLGYWKVADEQNDLMMEVYADILKNNKYENISDINFCKIKKDSYLFDEYSKKIGLYPEGIKFHFNERIRAEKLKDKDQNKLLVTSYSWDSNCYPGNEYWVNSLDASQDPIAACCSTIPELQNPEINPMVSGANTWSAGKTGIHKLGNT